MSNDTSYLMTSNPVRERPSYNNAYYNRPQSRFPNERSMTHFVKLVQYDGETELEVFLNQVEQCKRHNRWTDEQTKTHVVTSLKGKAARVLMTPGANDWSINELFNALKQ